MTRLEFIHFAISILKDHHIYRIEYKHDEYNLYKNSNRIMTFSSHNYKKSITNAHNPACIEFYEYVMKHARIDKIDTFLS